MKNNYLKFFSIIIINFFITNYSFAEDFIFNVTELEIFDNGNLYKGINGGKITTTDGLIIISDTFEYIKSENKLKAFGNVKIKDNKNNLTVLAEQIIYLKNKEKIYTKGKTIVNIEDKYTVDTINLYLYRDEMILSSLNKTFIINLLLGDEYTLNEFEYLIDKELLKGKEVQFINYKDNKTKKDKYFFKNLFFDLKNKKFLSNDLEVRFDKLTYDNDENDPRLKGITATGDEFNTYLEKAIFTTCKENDKCPPWVIESKKVRHDKKKKLIIYKDAWLKVYDIPILYYPKFFHPDPTVKRQSGFLKPSAGSQKNLGDSIYTPYFYVISRNTDMTIKPRIYSDGKFVFQNEFRRITKNSYTISDFSLAKENDSLKSNKSHLFINSNLNLKLDNFLKSELKIQLEKTSSDNYLKLYNLESPLLNNDAGTLETYVMLNLDKDEYTFTTSFSRFETLEGSNNDRYQYILPSYDFSKNYDLSELGGNINFTSSGSNNLDNTNRVESNINNNLNFTSYDNFFKNGVKNNYNILLKNLNTVGKNSNSYKSSPQSEMMSLFTLNTSLPLLKSTSKNINTFTPKLSLRFSPNQTKKHTDTDRKLNIENIFTNDRLSLGDSFENGGSATLGFEFKKEKINKKIINNQEIKQLEDFFELKLATVFREKKDKNLPLKSSLGEKQSNYVGEMKYNISENFKIDYNFSIKDDFNTIEYSSIDTKISFDKFYSQFTFLKESGYTDSENFIQNKSSYTIDENNSILFNTRRNRKINLTEYYDLIYKYKNDCLEASLQYKKNFYNDADIKPSEDLFFSITIIPLTTFSPDKIIR